MPRKFGTTRGGIPFSEGTIKAVWQKASPTPEYSPAVYRRDVCGALICFDDYGVTSSPHGWEIDHILPVAHGGIDDLSNLQALHWENNRNKADRLDQSYCTVT